MRAIRHLHVVLCLVLVLAFVVACSNSGEEMRRQLNELQARNQADSILNDTATAIALAAYFDDNGTQNEQLEAHYLLARTWTDLGQAPRALEEYQNAAALADTTCLDSLSNHWLSRIYGHMGELLYRDYLPKNALLAYQRAYSFSKRANEERSASLFYAQKSRCYYDLSLPDSSAYIMENAIKMLLECGDTIYANSFKGPLSYLFVQRGDFAKAKEYLDCYEYHSLINEQTLNLYDNYKLLFVYKGFLYQGLEQYDSALYYYNKSLLASNNINNRILTYRGLSQTYAKINQPDSASKYGLLYGDASNESNKQDISMSLLSMQHLYDYNRFKATAQQKTIEASHANLRLLVIILISTVLLSILIIVLINLWNRHKLFRLKLYNKYTTDILGYIATKEKLYHLEKQKVINEHLVRQAKEDLASFRNSIVETRKQYGDNNELGIGDYLLKNQTIVNLKAKGRKGQVATERELHELRRAVNIYLPEFSESLQSIDYHLQPRDICICMLLKLKFAPSEISSLLHISSQALSNNRKRLLKRMFGIDGSSSLFDEKIQEISSGDVL